MSDVVIERDDDPVVYAARLVVAAVADRRVNIGRLWNRPGADIWIAVRHMSGWCYDRKIDPPFVFNAALLRQAVKRGLLYERAGRPPHFTSPEKWLAAEAEERLTPAERADRTTVAVRAVYETNLRQYGDEPRFWAVDTQLMVVPQDGVEPAVACGLLVKSTAKGFSGRLVPAECADAFFEALILADQRTERRAAHHADVSARLRAFAGPALRDELSMSLSTSQMERLLALLSG